MSALEYLHNSRQLTMSGGFLVISTDNFGSLKNLYRLSMGRKIAPDLGEVLSATSFKTEAIHRKEFNWLELRHLLEEANFKLSFHEFTWQAFQPCSQVFRLKYILEFLIPNIRPHQILCATATG